MAEHIFFMVATLINPAAEPFAVVRVDTDKREGDGCEGRVESLHWSEYVAEQIAGQLTAHFREIAGNG